MAVETAYCGVNVQHVESVDMSKPNPLSMDSQSAEDLAVNPLYHKRSRHIEIKYHWVREHVDPDGEFGIARLIYV